MNFKEDGLESKFRTDTVVSDRDSGRVVNRNFRQIYLQFPYFTKELDECSTLSDKLNVCTEEYEQLEQNARCAERTGFQPS